MLTIFVKFVYNIVKFVAYIFQFQFMISIILTSILTVY